MESIKQVLMRRDCMSESDADALISEAKVQMQEYIDEGDFFSAENICQDYFGLEPDYLMELLQP